MYHHEAVWKNPKTLIVFHGLGEHSGRYCHVPHYMKVDMGSVLSFDHRGHGRSEGIRGHIEHFDLLAQDAALFVRKVDAVLREKFGESQIHLFAHSLGAHIALRMLFSEPDLPPIRSMTLSAPFLAIKAKVPFIKKMAAQGLSHIWGSLQLDTALDVHTLTHDPEVVEVYKKDQLVHSKMTPRFYTTMLEAMKNTLSRDSGVNVPLQMLVPLLDALVDPEVSIDFYKNLKHRDKILKTYPDFFHEPMNEIGKEIVFQDILSWIGKHGKS